MWVYIYIYIYGHAYTQEVIMPSAAAGGDSEDREAYIREIEALHRRLHELEDDLHQVPHTCLCVCVCVCVCKYIHACMYVCVPHACMYVCI